MAHKTNKRRKHRQHPLDILLRKMPGERESTLKFWAHVVFDDWDTESSVQFRDGIKAKIRAIKYRPPDSKEGLETFEKILEDAEALQEFLSPDVLIALEKWMILREILGFEREHRSKKQMISGYPVQFHRSLMTEIQRHFAEIEVIARKYDAENGIKNYGPMVFREIVRQFNLLRSFRWPQPWTKLLKQTNLGFSPRDEEVAIRVEVFKFLKGALTKKGKSERPTLSDQFLRALTLLVMAAPDATSLPRGDALRKAFDKRERAGTTSIKSSKNS